ETQFIAKESRKNIRIGPNHLVEIENPLYYARNALQKNFTSMEEVRKLAPEELEKVIDRMEESVERAEDELKKTLDIEKRSRRRDAQDEPKKNRPENDAKFISNLS
ncbi:hypothetical protein U1Q18_051988, partial [Sarracenia purpurea var. burkii]